MISVRGSVVTMEKRVATIVAICIAASAMPITGLGQFARCQQPRVAEAGDHMSIHPLLASGLDLLQHTDRCDGFVKMALN